MTAPAWEQSPDYLTGNGHGRTGAVPSAAMAREGVGALVRDWRLRRRRSQLDLALDAGVSTRHLSFVETGRARPSPELVLTLAERLDVPIRDRNELLLAAGYAPRYAETPLDAASMDRVRASLRRMLDAHDPFPGVVVDRQWNVVLANRGAGALVADLPVEVTGPPLNIFRASLHPDGLAARTLNLDEWAAYLYGQLRRAVTSAGDDPVLGALLDEVSTYPCIARLGPTDRLARPGEDLVLPLRLAVGDTVLSLFTTMTRFGTPLDVTLDELAIELFFPADRTTEQALRQRSGEP
jgi:transcriptional regulator with XRE-family HTH domain